MARRFFDTSALLMVVRLTGFHLQEAERLVRRKGISASLRTLDALQLAVALDLRKRYGLAEFVCADKRLCNMAAAEGLSVNDPEQP
jgi:predicted nucleic acid-binding protein